MLSPSPTERIVIGTDLDPSDGISVDWQVPEGLSEASLRGEALCSGSQVVPSLHSGILYSGDPPPEGVCVLASASQLELPTCSVSHLLSSEAVAKLIPGDFAPVLDHTLDGWYQIGAGQRLLSIGATESSPDTGWISNHVISESSLGRATTSRLTAVETRTIPIPTPTLLLDGAIR